MYVVSIPYRKFCYYMHNFLDDTWFEISEKEFVDAVVNFRDLYLSRYLDFECNTLVFSDIDTGYDLFKRVSLKREKND